MVNSDGRNNVVRYSLAGATAPLAAAAADVLTQLTATGPQPYGTEQPDAL